MEIATKLEIPGWMTEEECDFLHQWVKDSPPDALIVEVGSWLGRSTAAEYTAMHGEQALVAIDTWLGQPDLRQKEHVQALETDLFLAFMDNMKSLGIHPCWYNPGLIGPMYLRAQSVDAATRFQDRSLHRLFLDSDHREVGHDLDIWGPKMRPDGEIAGHDWNWVGVKEMVEKRYHVSRIIADIFVIDQLSNQRG